MPLFAQHIHLYIRLAHFEAILFTFVLVDDPQFDDQTDVLAHH